MDEALLHYYAQEWDRYTTGANYINRLFTYLNRHWVKREKDEGRKGVYTVYTVRILYFEQEVDSFFQMHLDVCLFLAITRAMENQLLSPHPVKE